MGKLSDYSLSKISPDLENFRVELFNILNYGKYSIPLITSLPTWKAQTGETVLYAPASGGTTMYFYKNSAWISSWSVIV